MFIVSFFSFSQMLFNGVGTFKNIGEAKEIFEAAKIALSSFYYRLCNITAAFIVYLNI